MELNIGETVYSGPKLNGGFKTEIDPENMEKFMLKALENYSNPKQTLVQEYVNNGKDSNREAGKLDSAMDIHVPTIAKPILIIRDYGVGLDNDGIINVYRKLGTTTKDKNNDLSDELAGGYGAGCKIWMRYTDACVIRAWKNGRKIEYLAHTANSKLGEYQPMLDIESTEPNGVEIEIALRSASDVADFKKAIRRMFLFWKDKPNLSEPMKWPTIHYENEHVIFCDESTLDDISISVDGTIYPLHNNLGATTKSGILKVTNNVKCKLVLKAKIKEVKVPMNREQVSDDDKLCDFLKSVMPHLEESIKEYANAILDKQFETMSDLRQAVNDARKHIKVEKRKFKVEKLKRHIVLEHDNYTMEDKNTDKFNLYSDYSRDPKYTPTTKILGSHVLTTVEQMTPYCIRKISKALETSFNMWRDEVPPEFVEFFGIDTYEEVCPKKKSEGRSSGGYSSTKLTNRQVHYKEVDSTGCTLELTGFIKKFPEDVPLIVTELINNTTDFNYTKWVKCVADFKHGEGSYNHVCLSGRTIRILKEAGYNNFHSTTEITITDSVLEEIAYSDSSPPGVLGMLLNHKEKILDPELEEVRKLIRRKVRSGYGIANVKYLDKEEIKKIVAIKDAVDTKYRKVMKKYPMLKLDNYNRDETNREILKWLFTNLALLLPSELKVEPQNNLVPQTTDLN